MLAHQARIADFLTVGIIDLSEGFALSYDKVCSAAAGNLSRSPVLLAHPFLRRASQINVGHAAAATSIFFSSLLGLGIFGLYLLNRRALT